MSVDPNASRLRWERLVEAGLVQGDMPTTAVSAPWYVAALVGIAAWLAALFMMVFLGIALGDIVKEPTGLIGLGAVVIAVSGVALRRFGERTFASQLALAFSLAGQGLLLGGLIWGGGRNVALGLVLFAAAEIALVVVIPHAAHRLLASLAASLALLFTAGWNGFEPLYLPIALAAFVAAQRPVVVASPRTTMLRPAAYGIALALAIAWIAVSELRGMLFEVAAPGAVVVRWVATVALAIVGAAAGAMLARDCGGQRRTVLAAAVALGVIALAAHAVPAVPIACVIVLYAFASGQMPLFGLGAVAFLAGLAHHYWRMDTTLLFKSASLAVLGATLVAGYFVLRRWPPGGARDAA